MGTCNSRDIALLAFRGWEGRWWEGMRYGLPTSSLTRWNTPLQSSRSIADAWFFHGNMSYVQQLTIKCWYWLLLIHKNIMITFNFAMGKTLSLLFIVFVESKRISKFKIYIFIISIKTIFIIKNMYEYKKLFKICWLKDHINYNFI